MEFSHRPREPPPRHAKNPQKDRVSFSDYSVDHNAHLDYGLEDTALLTDSRCRAHSQGVTDTRSNHDVSVTLCTTDFKPTANKHLIFEGQYVFGIGLNRMRQFGLWCQPSIFPARLDLSAVNENSPHLQHFYSYTQKR